MENSRLTRLREEVRELSDEEITARLTEIRRTRNVKQPAKKARKAAAKRVDTAKKLLAGLSPEEIKELLKG